MFDNKQPCISFVNLKGGAQVQKQADRRNMSNIANIYNARFQQQILGSERIPLNYFWTAAMVARKERFESYHPSFVITDQLNLPR